VENHLNINAYEQQGLCKLDFKSKETDPSKQQALEFDAKRSMWKAISVISSVIGAIPMMKTSNHCFPTLKSLLLKEKESPKIIKELAKLHELLEFNEDSIQFYKKLIEKDAYDATTVKQLIQNYTKIRDFEKAICSLSLLQCTGESDVVDKTFYVDTYIKGAKDSVEKNYTDLAKDWFLKAYQTIFRHHASISCPDDDAESSDILLLHTCEKGESCRQLEQVALTLTTFVQLRIAVNHNDCPPGGRKLDYLKNMMSNCRCVLVFFHETQNTDTTSTDQSVELAIDIVAYKYRQKTLVIRNGDTDDDLRSCKDIQVSSFDDETEDSVMQNTRHGKLLSDMLKKMSEMF
jgi:tetratricopeptide (TPR) repeat protein